MTRTDRLYALVEELRAASPRPRSARWLADRFEVSSRTIERDLSGLQRAGLPIWAEPGRAGGYVIDAAATLGPTGFTVDEALAVLIGLGTLRRGPFRQSARTAARKVLAVMPDEDARRVTALAGRVHLLEASAPGSASTSGVAPDPRSASAPGAAPALRSASTPGFASALRSDRVVRLRYRDGSGEESSREVEPLGSIGKDGAWYLIAWCRLRGGVRAFREDRMLAVEVTDERPQPRTLRREDLDIRYGHLRSVMDDD